MAPFAKYRTSVRLVAAVGAAGLALVMVLSMVVILAPAKAADQQPGLAVSQPVTKHLPHIVILATGGTIAGKSQSDGRYTSGLVTINDLVAAVPELRKIANISVVQVSSIGSQDMNEAVWSRLSDEISKLFAHHLADGVVVTHGTDTLEETAFFLEAVRNYDAPVVITGAMKPSDAVGADGPMNLRDAVSVAASSASRARGVLVVLNGTVHAARWVEKVNSFSINAFESTIAGPEGYVDSKGVQFMRLPCRTGPGPFLAPNAGSFPRVDIVFAHAGMNNTLIESAVTHGAKGIVLAGVGNGNASISALTTLQKLARKIIIVRASRVKTGIVERNIEVDDDRSGFVASLDLSPQKARVLVQLLLAQGIHDLTRVQKEFRNRCF